MVYAVHWTDMQKVERTCYCDDDVTALIVMQALRADHRLYAIGPHIENMGVEGDDRGPNSEAEGSIQEVQGQAEAIRSGQGQVG